MGDEMTKRVAPVTNAHGYVDAATIAELLKESVFDLSEGQRLFLPRPLTFVVLKLDGNLLGVFEFAEDAEVARLRTEKKANFQHFLISSVDAALQIVFKKDGFYAYEPDDRLHYISHTVAHAAPMPRRPKSAAAEGHWNGPSYTK